MDSRGEVLFMRGEKGSSQDDDDDDIWDDRALVEAYDQAVKSAKEKVAVRLGLDSASGTESASSKTNDDDKKKKKSKKKGKHEWTVGSYCRAIYLKDGLIYEANIQKIQHELGSCTVKYIGYGNEEEVPLKSLLPSNGKKARKLQMQQALLDDECLENGYGSSSKGSGMDCTEDSGKETKKSKHTKGSKTSSNRMEEGDGTIPPFPSFAQDKTGSEWYYPPPPPFPNGRVPVSGQLPAFPSMSIPPMPVPIPPPPVPLLDDASESDTQALSAMLMAWYMSGFHTGYYHGLKQAKAGAQSVFPNSCPKGRETHSDKNQKKKSR